MQQLSFSLIKYQKASLKSDYFLSLTLAVFILIAFTSPLDAGVMHDAVRMADFPLFYKTLKEKPQQVNQPEANSSQTVLHLAAAMAYVEVVEALIDAGANVNSLDKNGETPMHKACELKNFNCTNGLQPRQRKPTDPEVCVRTVVCALASAGADINALDKTGKTPLHRCSAWGAAGVIRVLLELGANTDIQDQTGRTPIHWAIFSGGDKAINALVKHGVNLNIRDKSGKTPLDLAKDANYTDVVKLLIEHGAKE